MDMKTKHLKPVAYAALALLLPVAAKSAVAATVVVTSESAQGWADITQRTADGRFEVGPLTPPLGIGSYEITTGAGGSGPDLPQGGAGTGGKLWLSTQQFDGLDLSALTALSYSTFVDPSSTASATVAPALQLQVDLDGNGTRDTTLVYEPAYNGTVVKGQWQTWDANNGLWWSTTATTLGPASTTYFTLDDLLVAYPTAQIVSWYSTLPDGTASPDGYGLQIVGGQNVAGSPWSGFVGNVDAVTVNTTTFDFEPVASEVDTDGDGVPDVDDSNDNSDTRGFVDVNLNEPGVTSVPNTADENGVTIQDQVNLYAANAKTHGQYVSNITKLANSLNITNAQRQELKTAASKSSIGKPVKAPKPPKPTKPSKGKK
jgi:hypothetical protein